MPSQPRTSRRVLAGGLVAGLAVTGAAFAVQPEQQAQISTQTQVNPVVIEPRTATRMPPTRASRGAARTALPMKQVTRTVATGSTFSGEASWYGGYFQGRRTANGERFDTRELTAASKTLAFGTKLRVCRTGRCVVVRINDRGPYVGDRVLDLSQAAAERLGYSGVAHVTATPVATRTVTVVDTAARARQQAVQRREVARQHQAARARAARERAAQLAATRAAQQRSDAVLASADEVSDASLALATGLVVAGAGGLLQAGRRRTRS